MYGGVPGDWRGLKEKLGLLEGEPRRRWKDYRKGRGQLQKERRKRVRWGKRRRKVRRKDYWLLKVVCGG